MRSYFFALFLTFYPCFSILSSQADVLWTENAENGLSNVLDYTGTEYSLIQSDIVAEGANAFHLANPGFQDNWFEIDQSITIQADTKLFLASRLTYATSSQVAKVQISTDGGSSWPTDIYSQTGTDGPGDGAFSLKEFDLSPYASQSLRFRFYYDRQGSSAYPQTGTGFGWYIDDIQIADKLQKIQYSIGNPSDLEQQYLEYINRSRADALVEAARLANETDPNIVSAYSFFGITGTNIQSQFQTSIQIGLLDQHAQPLSFNEKLNLAADLHTQDMFDNQFQGHNNSSNPPAPLVPNGGPGSRLNSVGYSYLGYGENVYAYADSVAHGHAGFDVDWGNTSNPGDPNYNPSFAGQGMQNPAGHRRSIHNDNYKEIGIGVVNGMNGSVGPQLVTQDFGNPGNATFVTGVVFDDLNSNSFYDIGEGVSGVRVDVDGSAFFAISSSSGGYSVPVVGDGIYDVLFSGGGYSNLATTADILSGRNVKIDYLVSSASYAADFDNDNDVDGFDLVKWQMAYGTTAVGDADGDGDSDGSDYLIWQREYGSGLPLVSLQIAVPEPQSIILLAMASLCILTLSQRELS